MLKQFFWIVLVVLMLCTDCVLLSEPNNVLVSQQTNAQSKGFGSFKKVFDGIKSKTRKLYDCVLGNDETCTPDEIMLTRVVIFIAILAGYGKVNAFREARRLAEGQRRVQARINNGVSPEELDQLRQHYNDEYEQEFFDGDAPSGFMGLAHAMGDSFNAANNSDEQIINITDTFKQQVETKRQEFFANHKNKNTPESCIVCTEDDFRERASDLGNVPCANEHAEGLCIGCLARLMFDGFKCPLCRNDLLS